MNYFARWTCVLMLAGVLPLVAAAQQITGDIRGTVTDPSGAVIPAAKITAVQSETGFARTVPSDQQGKYVLLELPVGHYRLLVEARGFHKFVQEGISLDVNENASMDVRLAVGGSTEEVQVRGNAPLVETAVTSLGKTVQEREIVGLPLNERHFTQLGLLQPGVVPLTQGLKDAGGSLRAGQAYAVNGQRPESNNFLIDGANNFNGVDAGFVIEPPVDAIAEFRILTNTANAEFGHSTGSTTNIITRSGGNEFHGGAWEFLRNDALDASNAISRSVEPLKRNQFGGTFGGPVKEERTFFFGYYEGIRNRRGESTLTAVPTALERTGDFSQSGGPLINEFDGTEFANDKLPFINPISQALLAFYPLPNAPGIGPNAYIASQTEAETTDQFGIRVDHYLSARDVLNFRYIFTQTTASFPLSTAGANVPGFPVGEDQRAQNFVFQQTHTFSPVIVGQVRLSFLRNKFLFDEHLNHTTPASLGFQYQPSLAGAIGPPFVQVAGFASIGDPITGPRNTFEDAFDLSGSLTWVHGRHEFKFGGGYERDEINVLQGIATNGFFVFSNFPVSNSFASFEFGQPVFFLQGGGDFSRVLRGNNANAYAQDTFKINSRLTLNAGLRYELPFPYTEIHNRQNLFEPGVQSQVFPSAPAGLLYPGDPGVPAGLIPTKKTAFAPRVGLAWDVQGNAKWLVTSAYGIFYEPYYTGQGGPLQTPISAPPYLQTPQISLPNFSDPYNGGNPFNGTFAQPMTLLTLDKNLSLPYAQDWNLDIQRAFGADWLLEAGYVGTKGTRLPRFIEGNPTTFTGATANNADQRRLYSGCTVAQPTPCNFSSVGLIAGIANSNYNALQVSLKKRFSQQFSFLASYTLSKTIDDVSSFNITGSAAQSTAGENDLAQNPFDLSAERGRSIFDARHRLVLSYEWNLPFWRQPENWYQKVLGNWEVNGIVTLMTGTPFTVYDSRDVSLQGGAPEISGFSSDRPNLIGDPNAGSHTTAEWFNTAAFQQLRPGQPQRFGNEGRNVVEGPGFKQWDVSAIKNFRIRENKTLQFRAEFFNVFNQTNYRLPNNDINSPNFGKIQGSLDPRLIQLALKFLF